MTEYRVQCRTGSDDYVTARRGGRADTAIVVTPFEDGNEGMDVYASADDARAFARGILALCDEIDGGEKVAAEDISGTLPVGTRVRVLEAWGISSATGMEGTVHAVTDQAGRLRVRLDSTWTRAGDERELYVDRWEVLDEPSEPAPSISPEREEIFRRAAALVRAIGARPDDPEAIVRVAQWLAPERW